MIEIIRVNKYKMSTLELYLGKVLVLLDANSTYSVQSSNNSKIIYELNLKDSVLTVKAIRISDNSCRIDFENDEDLEDLSIMFRVLLKLYELDNSVDGFLEDLVKSEYWEDESLIDDDEGFIVSMCIVLFMFKQIDRLDSLSSILSNKNRVSKYLR